MQSTETQVVNKKVQLQNECMNDEIKNLKNNFYFIHSLQFNKFLCLLNLTILILG